MTRSGRRSKPAERRALLVGATVGVSLLACALFTLLICALYTSIEITGAGKAFMGTRPKCENYNLPDPLVGWKLLPNFKVYSSLPGYENTLLFETDRYGFRNHGPELPPAAAVMLLGDSFVQGYNLAEDETMAARLEALLHRPVYNFGVGGYSTDQEVVVAREALGKFRTDWVVVMFFINDLPFLDKPFAYAKNKSFFELGPDGKFRFDRLHTAPVPKFLEAKSLFGKDIVDWPPRATTLPAPGYEEHWLDLFGSKFRSHLSSFLSLLARPGEALELVLHWRELNDTTPWHLRHDYPGKTVRQIYTDPSVLAKDWNLAFQLFSELDTIVRRHRARLLVTFLPEIAQVERPEMSFTQPQRDFTRLCHEHGLACIEPLDEYVHAQAEGDLYLRDEGHLSARGAAFTAGLIKRFIDEHR